ncbi:RICIN domain-containing protein [Streptomyces sp. NBC_00996]|uniref:RICIN domain-containing protein n=1 Tax=Streptomyces sp. NBC_00996 TaxID=2903710 RepID=UPI00386BC4C4|nr:ricin-type beta-trefoil lectin domain protein [Streptomyces sp. NBC_00996]
MDDRAKAWQKSLSVLQPTVPGTFPTVASFFDPPGSPGSKEKGLFTQVGFAPWVSEQFWKSEDGFYDDPSVKAAKAEADQVQEIGGPLYGQEPDASLPTDQWRKAYAEHQAWQKLTADSLHPLSADDARLFLASGGFPTSAPAPGSLAYRIAVEDLKSRFASCNWHNPLDPDQVLGKVVKTASEEWQQEIADQATQRTSVFAANKNATSALQKSALALGDMLGQSWTADHITRWQDYWAPGGPGWIGDSPVVVQFHAAKGMCLDVEGNKTANGTPVQIYTCSGSSAQKWVLGEDGTVHGVHSGKCLDVQGSHSENGTKIQIWTCNGSAAQKWDYSTTKTTSLRNKATGKCLDLHTYDKSYNAWLWSCNGSGPQQLDIAPSGHNGTDDLGYPTKAMFSSASSELTKARADAKTNLGLIKKQAAAAGQAVKDTDTSLAEAYRKADTMGVPRGRGMLVGLQKAQVTKASAAALDAMEKAAETAYAATKASAGDSATLMDRAKAAAANAKAQFRLAAAKEAEQQAKAAMDAAEVQKNNARSARDTAKTELGVAVTAEADAKSQAATAHAKRLAAQAQEKTAKAEKATAAAKQAEAAEHKKNAETQATKATEADKKANKAETTASQKRQAAEKSRDQAKGKRDDAWDAEQKANAARAKADAKDAYADSLDAGDAATAARTAANEADTAATTAEAAAKKARGEADAATKAAADADAAATRAEAAAKRARSDADAAKAAKLKADADVKTATSAAADAIKAAGDAATAARTAVKLADDASKDATTSRSHADTAAKQAGKAVTASATAAGHAYVTAQAAADAGHAAEQVAKPANDAIQLGSPYITSDSAAAQAEQDAKDARAAATRADTAATEAEQAAKDADKYAKEAQEAADRAEKAEKAKQINDGTVPDENGHSIGNVFYVNHIEKIGDPEVIKKTDGCDHWWNHLAYTGNCTITSKIKYKAVLDLYLCSAEGIDPQKLMCPTEATTYLGEVKTDELSQEVTHNITIAEWQDGVDPIDILFGSWIECTKKFTSGFESGSWGGCGWAALDVASLFAGKLIRPIAEAVRAVDAAFVTGIGVRDALQALKTLKGVDAAAVAAIEREVQTYEEAVTACERNSFPGGTRVLMADGTRRPILDVRVGDLVLATDPASGRARPEPVTDTFRHRTDHLVDVSLAGGGTLTSTSGHRVYVAGHNWVHVSDLRVGDRLRTSDGALQSVTALHDRPGLAPRPVYDLTVDGLHTFYVRPQGGHSRDVLVHNCLNLVQDEDIEGAHTLREHVRPGDTAMANAAEAKGRASRWNDEATAVRSVQAAFDAWIKKPSNVKRLDRWLKEQSHNPVFDPRHDLLDFEWQLRNEGSLGRVWVKDGVQGERTGNRVVVQLKYAGKHKPSRYVVYTSYPK